MALNIEALKNKLDRLNGGGRGGQLSDDIMKLEQGEYVLRIVPWPSTIKVSEPPFAEKYFYYGLSGKRCAPGRDEADPVRDFRDTLFADRTPENMAIAKLLKPKLKTYVAVVNRADAEPKPRLIGLSTDSYKDLIGLMIDPDYGDVSDPNEGFDLKVTVAPSGRMFNGKPVMDTKIACKPKSTPLAASKAKIDALINAVPNIDDIFKPWTYDELTKALDDFMKRPDKGDDGSSASTASQTAGDRAGAAQSKKRDDGVQDLDNAFDDLMGG